MADGAPAAEGRVGRSLRCIVSGCDRAVSVLAALAGGRNGWTALQSASAPAPGKNRVKPEIVHSSAAQPATRDGTGEPC